MVFRPSFIPLSLNRESWRGSFSLPQQGEPERVWRVVVGLSLLYIAYNFQQMLTFAPRFMRWFLEHIKFWWYILLEKCHLR
jgi:hypothetical protein